MTFAHLPVCIFKYIKSSGLSKMSLPTSGADNADQISAMEDPLGWETRRRKRSTPRRRGRNFSKSERDLLKVLVAAHPNAKSKKTDFVSMAEKSRAWRSITAEFNAAGLECSRDIIQLKTAWKNGICKGRNLTSKIIPQTNRYGPHVTLELTPIITEIKEELGNAQPTNVPDTSREVTASTFVAFLEEPQNSEITTSRDSLQDDDSSVPASPLIIINNSDVMGVRNVVTSPRENVVFEPKRKRTEEVSSRWSLESLPRNIEAYEARRVVHTLLDRFGGRLLFGIGLDSAREVFQVLRDEFGRHLESDNSGSQPRSGTRN